MKRSSANLCCMLVVFVSSFPRSGSAQSEKRSATPVDPLPANSVWVNEAMKLTLTVVERKGESFRGKLVAGDAIERTLTGTVKGNNVAWLAKNVQAIKGGQGHDNTGIINGDRIEVEYMAKAGVGKFTLRRSDTTSRRDVPQASSNPPPKLDDSSFDRWRTYIRPSAEELEWMKIGWRPSFWQAVIEAQQKTKPILVFAMNGNACGFT